MQITTGTGAGLVKTSSTAYETSHVMRGVPAAGCALIGLLAYNSNSSAQFIQIHDASTLPAETAVPAIFFTVPGNSNVTFDFGITGIPMLNGIVVCNSSTGPTKTIGSADCFFCAIHT